MRRRPRLDENQREVVAALRALGASVQSLASVGSGCPDLLVGVGGINLLLEVKPGAAKDKRRRELNEAEMRWHDAWRGHVVVATTVDEAIAVVFNAPLVRE